VSASAPAAAPVVPPARLFTLAVLLALVAAVYVHTAGIDVTMGRFWVLGLGFGVVLQRTRLCFASAFRDVLLLGHARNLKGILVGMAVATVGFSALMTRQVPNTALGILPPEAHVLPIGLHTVVGALLFGFGMVIAGGCVSGSIYRMGEGYVASWVAFAGILGGLTAAAYTWNAWYDLAIAGAPQVWLPSLMGHGAAVVLTLILLGGLFLLASWWEHKNGMDLPEPTGRIAGAATFRGKVANGLKRVFVHGWPVLIGGALLGGLNVIAFMTARPWGFTGEVSRWGLTFMTSLGAGPGELAGVGSIPGCVLDPGSGEFLNPMLLLVTGMFAGSLFAAIAAGEFKIRIPKKQSRFVQSVAGGLIMGYGSGTAVGCTIGAFFSSVPSLGLNGWVWAVCLLAGAWLGTHALKRLP